MTCVVLLLLNYLGLLMVVCFQRVFLLYHFKQWDPFGNTTTQSFTVTVVDNQNPVITCPELYLLAVILLLLTLYPLQQTTAQEFKVNLVSGPASGGTFAPGTTTVTYEAVDASSTASCSSMLLLIRLQLTQHPLPLVQPLFALENQFRLRLTVSLGTNAQWLWYVGSLLVDQFQSTLTTTTYYVRAVDLATQQLALAS